MLRGDLAAIAAAVIRPAAVGTSHSSHSLKRLLAFIVAVDRKPRNTIFGHRPTFQTHE